MLGAIEHRTGEHRTGAKQASDSVHAAYAPPGRGGYLGQLRRELGIAAGQATAWEGFASSLRANARRMSATRGAASEATDPSELAFGSLQDRTAALAAMRLAAADLLAALTPAQRHRAARLLPLCCLPAAGHG